MKRNAVLTAARPDPVRVAVGLPVGIEGQYFVGETGFAGQDEGPDVLEYNDEPTGQHGLWCKWEPTEDGKYIQWSGAEKFYSYKEWIQYIITHFLTPWGRTITGSVSWSGEEKGDTGRMVITNNVMEIKPYRTVKIKA